MPALTWRDTAAPNFETSVDAQRLAGQSVNNAFSGLSDALGKFHEWQQGQAGNALANNLANYPNAAAEDAARANGSLFNGVDRSNLTPAALGSVNSNASTLLSNAADAAKLPYVGPQAAATLAGTNATTGATNATAGLTNSATATSDQNRAQSGTTFGRGTKEYAEDQIAQQVGADAAKKANTPADVLAAIDSDPRAQDNPFVTARAAIHGTNAFNSIYGPGNASTPVGSALAPFTIPGGPAGTSDTAESTAAKSYLNGVSAHPDRPGDTSNLHPDFATKMAAAIQDARAAGLPVSMESGYRTNSTTGSAYDASGMSLHGYGAAADVSGIGAASSPQAQQWAKIAAAHGLYNPYGVDDPKEFNHWQMVPWTLEKNADAQKAIAGAGGDQGKIWNAIAPVSGGTTIDPGKITSDLMSSLGTVRTAKQNIGAYIGQGQAEGIAGQYLEDSRSKASSEDVAKDLTSGDKDHPGLFPNVPVNKVQTALDHIKQIGAQNGAVVNAALAKDILTTDSQRSNNWFKSWLDNDGVYNNDAAITAEVKKIADGTRENQAQGIQTAQNASDILDQRKDAASAAFSRLTTAITQARTRPALAGSVATLQKNYNDAKLLLDQAAQSAGRFKPTFQPPAAGANGASAAISNASQPKDAVGFGQ